MPTHLRRAAEAVGAAAAERDIDEKRKPAAERYSARDPVPPPSRVLLTVRQLAEQQPGLTVGGIRWDLFNRRTNGLDQSGAVVRRGRRLLIDANAYVDWLTRGQKGVA
ncbi:MAG: hypothetical protein WCA32_09995 [Chromatiaceae bacterium]